MAYTYDDFLSTANKEGLIKQFTDDDLQIAQKNPEFGFSMLSVMKDANSAKTTEQKLLATEVANQLRSSYGSLGQGKSEGSFQYANETAYQKALADAMNVEEFHYDAEQDPVYDAYKKAMVREGERASANAIARASAMTGGVPSSYAVMAAQQAQNYYGAQAADKLVALEQNAYQRYLNDFDKKRTELSTIGSDRSDAYAKWLNAQELARTEQQDERSKEQQEYANALALYQVLGYATPEIAEVLGIPVGAAQGTDRPTVPSVLPEGTQPQIQPQTQPQTGTLTDAQIRELQTFLGVDADGIWGPLSSNAAGGLTKEQAWTLYQQLLAQGERPPQTVVKEKSMQPLDERLANRIGPKNLAPLHTREESATGGSVEVDGMIDGRYPTAPVNKTNTDNRVLVEGKYMTWSEILAGVQNGTIKEQYDPATGRYSYVFVRDKGKGSDGMATTLRGPTMHTTFTTK